LSRSRLRGSFWPSATQRALMEVVLGPEEQAAARWQSLQPLELATLEPGCLALLPLLEERLREAVPDEPQLPRLVGTYRSIFYRNSLLLDRLAVLLTLLRERVHVEPLLVGGMSAVLRWYPRIGLRPVQQLELIVERETAAEAVKVAGYAGWRPAGEARSLTRLSDESQRVLVVHHGAPADVVGSLGVEEGTAALRARAVVLPDAVGTPLVLDPADEFLFACGTGARTALVRRCDWLVDVYHLLHCPEAPGPAELLERVRRVHLVAAACATLRYLDDLAGDAVLGEYVTAFDAEPVRRRDRMAFALAGAGGSRTAGMSHVLAGYLQATADDPPVRAVAGLPRHLQERWNVSSLAGVPVLALKKSRRLLSAQPQASAPDRNRSASS
jgi:Uncharacterised nucleotidyltransferase